MRLVAQTLKNHLRPGDHASRYGGEEFAVLLPKTGLDEAMTIAENIRMAIKARELMKKSSKQNLGYITLSIGVAAYRRDDTQESFVQRADRYLYAAKQAGRDRTVCGDAVAEQRADGTVLETADAA